MTPYPAIVPYLAVEDAPRAIDFYKTVFGAEEKMRAPAPDGERVMHAELNIHGGLVMLADAYPERGFPAPRPEESVPMGIMVACGTADEVDATYSRAVAAGARSETEPSNAAWGSRFAGVIDPFGHRWWLHAPVEKGAA